MQRATPTTLDYYNRGNLTGVGFTRTFPAAACANFTSHAQGDPGGGCLNDAAQDFSQIQPSQKYVNFFARGTLAISPVLQGYAELNWYNNKNEALTTPTGISNSVGFPGGPVSNAASALRGASHNPTPNRGATALPSMSGRATQGESDFSRPRGITGRSWISTGLPPF